MKFLIRSIFSGAILLCSAAGTAQAAGTPVIDSVRFTDKPCLKQGARVTVTGKNLELTSNKIPTLYLTNSTNNRTVTTNHVAKLNFSSQPTATRMAASIPKTVRLTAQGTYYMVVYTMANHGGVWVGKLSNFYKVTGCAKNSIAPSRQGMDLKNPSPKISATTLPPNTKLAAGKSNLTPVITGYKYDGKCVKKGASFKVLGKNFGVNQHRSGKGVAFGGNGLHLDLRTESWNNNIIVVRLQNDSRIDTSKYYYTGIETTQPKRWLSNINKFVAICKDGGNIKK